MHLNSSEFGLPELELPDYLGWIDILNPFYMTMLGNPCTKWLQLLWSTVHELEIDYAIKTMTLEAWSLQLYAM